MGIDAETLEIRAVEITGSRIWDAPVLPDLPKQIPQSHPIGSVTADSISDTKSCHVAIAASGAAAVIPPRRNSRSWKGLLVRNEALRACKRFGRGNWKTWTGYHQRSRDEAKTRCLKRLGARIMAKDFDSQDTELQIRIAFLNRFIALSTPDTVRIAQKGAAIPQT